MIARRSFLLALAGLASSPALSDDSTADIFVFAGQSNIQVNTNTTLKMCRHIVRDAGVQIWDCENKCFVVYEAGINSLQPVRDRLAAPRQLGTGSRVFLPDAQGASGQRAAYRQVRDRQFATGEKPPARRLVSVQQRRAFRPAEEADFRTRSRLCSDREKFPSSAPLSGCKASRTRGRRRGRFTVSSKISGMVGSGAQALGRRFDETHHRPDIHDLGANARRQRAVRSAQEAVAHSTPNSILVSTDDAPHDGHFLPEGATKFGRDIFEAFTRLL